MRQNKVKSVTLLYRRTAQEMPAYAEEVEAAIEEGIRLETLVSPTSIRYIRAAEAEGVKIETFVEPVKIDARNGRLADIKCIRNKLGDVDSSGRRRPVPIPGTEFTIALDTLIVAIGEAPDSDCLASMGLELDKGGRLRVDAKTLQTNRKGVFAGGDLVTGPNTVVNAIAAGRKAAGVIDRYIHGKELAVPPELKLPSVFIEPATVSDEELEDAERAEPATLSAKSRKKSFAEVEMALSVEQAVQEARRCLRCDLEFTHHSDNEATECVAVEEKSA
jgi:NADH-quinone oxidoreductase subunit F